MPKCEWVYLSIDGCWETGCGKYYSIENDKPGSEAYHFCPNCGNEIEVKNDPTNQMCLEI